MWIGSGRVLAWIICLGVERIACPVNESEYLI
jgi:hypothetical protein